MLFLISLDMNLIGKKNVYLSLIIQARCIYVYVCIYNVARISISNSFICLTLCCNLVKSKLLILPILYCEYCIVLYSFVLLWKWNRSICDSNWIPEWFDKLGNNILSMTIKICISLYYSCNFESLCLFETSYSSEWSIFIP